MARSRVGFAVLVCSLALGCVPEPAPPSTVVRASLRVGSEVELGPLVGTDIADTTNHPMPELLCDQRDGCVVVAMTDYSPVVEITAFPMQHDGTPTGGAQALAASNELGFERRIVAAAGVDGFAVSYYEQIDLDGTRWCRWLQLLGSDGRPRGARIALVEYSGVGDPYSELWFDGRAYVVAVRVAGATTMIRVDATTGREIDRAPLASTISGVACGPVECIGVLGSETVLFRRDESPARARRLPIAPGQFAAARSGFAIWRWDDSAIEWLGVDGTSTGTTPASRGVQVRSGGETILVHARTASGIVLAEVDPRAPPATLSLRAHAGSWGGGLFPAWSGAHWLVGFLGEHVRAEWHWMEPDWLRVLPGSLDVDARFETPDDLRAASHSGLVLARDDDHYVAAWREYEDHFSVERLRIVRIASDGAITARAVVEGPHRARLAVGGGVIALVAMPGADGAFLQRFDRSLVPLGERVTGIEYGADIAWDGERFVVGADELARHSPDPSVPPIAMPPSGLPRTGSERTVVSTAGGVLFAWRVLDGTALARWDRARGWRDGAGVVVPRRRAVLGARGSTVALWESGWDDASMEWRWRLSTLDASAETLSVHDGAMQRGRFAAVGIAARPRGWILLAREGIAGEGQDLYGIETDDALASETPFLIEPLVRMSDFSGGIGCAPTGGCYVAYARWVIESPYRNGRARGRTLFAVPDGARCDAGHECASGHCVDGVCCDDACGGGDPDDCLACSAAAGALLDGRCAPRAVASACGGAECGGSCDGAGACVLECDAGIDGGGDDAGVIDAGGADAGLDAGPIVGGEDAGSLDAALPVDAARGDAGSASSGAGCSCRAGSRTATPSPWLALIVAALAHRRLRPRTSR